MERGIGMTDEENAKIQELQKVHERRQTIRQAADILGLSPRQVKRLSKRLKEEGPSSLKRTLRIWGPAPQYPLYKAPF